MSQPSIAKNIITSNQSRFLDENNTAGQIMTDNEEFTHDEIEAFIQRSIAARDFFLSRNMKEAADKCEQDIERYKGVLSGKFKNTFEAFADYESEEDNLPDIDPIFNPVTMEAAEDDETTDDDTDTEDNDKS